MTEKKTTVRINNTFQYIQLLNGVFELTDTEIKILAAFIDQYKLVKKAGLEINPFSTEMKKKVSEKLGRKDFNTLNNYIKSMHDKGALSKVKEGYNIRRILIPNKDKRLVFDLKWIKSN